MESPEPEMFRCRGVTSLNPSLKQQYTPTYKKDIGARLVLVVHSRGGAVVGIHIIMCYLLTHIL